MAGTIPFEEEKAEGNVINVQKIMAVVDKRKWKISPPNCVVKELGGHDQNYQRNIWKN